MVKKVVVLVAFFLHLCSKLFVRTGAAGSPVKFLPGFDGPLPFELESGYLGVGDSEDVQLFYYFIKSESNPKTDPLLLWLTGGPGCSALSGLLFEIGPITLARENYDGNLPTLLLQPNSWTKVANIIFLDLPVGTGFSYSKTKAAHQSNTTQACQQAYEFLLKWLIDHPEFVSNSLYVAGDSYAGVFVPIITQIILDGKSLNYNHSFNYKLIWCIGIYCHKKNAKENDKGFSSKINIKGYVLGNPYAVPDYDNYKIPFAHGMGLISDELFESWKKNCKGESYANINPENVKCYDDVQAFKQVVGKINEPHILEPLCSGSSFRSQKGFAHSRILLEQSNDLIRTGPFLSIVKCRSDVYVFSENWANDESVREALHVKKGSIGQWKRCSSNLDYITTTDDITPYHLNLSARGYRSLIYSGDHDFLVTYISTQAWIRSLNYSIIDEWRPWMVEDQVAGFARTYSNKMTFATVKGAGHTAPEYKPKECLSMILRWLSNKSL